MTKGGLPQTAGSPCLNDGGTAAVVHLVYFRCQLQLTAFTSVICFPIFNT